MVRWGSRSATAKWRARSGSPAATVTHTYSKDGVYTATLIVYLEPPFTAAAIRYVTNTRVKVGKKADSHCGLVATPRAGKAPFSVSFRAAVTYARDELGLRPGGRHESIRPGQAAAVFSATPTRRRGLSRGADRSPGVERAPAGVHRRRGACVEMPAVLVGRGDAPRGVAGVSPLPRPRHARLRLVLFAVGFRHRLWVAAAFADAGDGPGGRSSSSPASAARPASGGLAATLPGTARAPRAPLGLARRVRCDRVRRLLRGG